MVALVVLQPGPPAALPSRELKRVFYMLGLARPHRLVTDTTPGKLACWWGSASPPLEMTGVPFFMFFLFFLNMFFRLVFNDAKSMIA